MNKEPELFSVPPMDLNEKFTLYNSGPDTKANFKDRLQAQKQLRWIFFKQYLKGFLRGTASFSDLWDRFICLFRNT